MYLLLGGGYHPVGVEDADVHLDRCLLFGGFDSWSGSPVQICGWEMEGFVRAMRNDYTVQCERVGNRQYPKFESITGPLFFYYESGNN